MLSIGYHAQSQLNWLLSGSGVVAIIFGFATQNMLGGVIAGMSLQISKPYKVGDWLQVGDRFAEVMEINWRSTRLRTNDAIYLDIPNNEIVRHTIVNLHYPQELHAMRIRVGVDYGSAPNKVKDALLRATLHADGVQHEPPPKVFLVDFARLRDHLRDQVLDAQPPALQRHLRRHPHQHLVRIQAPEDHHPVPDSHPGDQPPHRRRASQEEHGKARTILETEPLFACLTEAQVGALVAGSRTVHFGRGERLIEQGAEGSSMFVMLDGTAQVSVAQNGSAIRVGVLRHGRLLRRNVAPHRREAHRHDPRRERLRSAGDQQSR